MERIALSPFTAWESFYVIIGSSAAALTGLQFVVIALVAESQTKSSSREIAAFGSPTIVHFCTVLLVSAILSAPWHTLSSPGVALGLCGIGGMTFSALVFRRAHRQTGYRLVMEDWLWHTAFPFLAYATLLASAVALPSHAAASLFLTGAAALFLLFIGIHNAWDAVTYVAVERWQPPSKRH